MFLKLQVFYMLEERLRRRTVIVCFSLASATPNRKYRHEILERLRSKSHSSDLTT